MTQSIKKSRHNDRSYYQINFPNEEMKKQWKKLLFAYRSKVDPDKPIYLVLFELVKNTLQYKLECNSLGIPNELFKKEIERIKLKLFNEKMKDSSRVEETIE